MRKKRAKPRLGFTEQQWQEEMSWAPLRQAAPLCTETEHAFPLASSVCACGRWKVSRTTDTAAFIVDTEAL